MLSIRAASDCVGVGLLIVVWLWLTDFLTYQSGYLLFSKVSTDEYSSMQHLSPYLLAFRDGELPMVFSVLLDQRIDGISKNP